MAGPLKGLVQGRTVVLDEAVPPLDGKHVRVVLEPVDESDLASAASTEAWRQWIASGLQGSIEDEGAPELP